MITYLIKWLFWNFVQSIVFTSLMLLAVYWFYIKKLPKTQVTNQPQYEEFKLEDTLLGMIDRNQDASEADLNRTSVLNLILQFFFQELKDTKAVRRFLVRRITVDFEELLTTKAAGKFIDRLSTRDFSLGTSFPVVSSVKIESYKLDSTKKLIDEVSILLDIEYKNGFSISVDADLIWGKSAYVHIKVALIKGRVRLQFSRQPFTHWSFAFVEEPIVEMDGSSQFEGRSMPKLTSLLVNQIRRSIKRKHTLPNYKIRFKPFFQILYNQKLYKSDLSEYMLKKKSNTAKFSECDEYTVLCQKLGVDLTSMGKLQIHVKACDRLPEALYSLNQAQNTRPDNQLMHKTSSSVSLNSLASSSSEKEQNFVYLTTSVDYESMEQLMDKRTSREHWPFIEFEIQKTSTNQMIGINFMEIFFINKTEICIQKIIANSLAGKIKTIKKFDILYSINQVRCTSLKSLNKLIQKSGFQPIKFVVQRPIIVSQKPIVNMANFPTRISQLIDEETSGEIDTKTINENFNINTSASALVDYYCRVSESAMTDATATLDLVALLADLDKDEDESRFQKSRDLKLEKENLFCMSKSRVPIQVDDLYEFNLSEQTKYLNVLLWAEQFVQKSARKRPLPIGYVTIPLNELAIDCWSTTKGESQSTFYFKPIEEMRASAVSRITKSHVISDHFGFDCNMALGNLTVNFKHLIKNQHETDKKDIASKIAQEIAEKCSSSQEKKNQTADMSDTITEANSENDDGSMHKFMFVQFNQIVNCEICKRKIWFKSAYKCAYCGFIIHQKCYDNAINKTICQRFFAQNGNMDGQEMTDEQNEWANDDSFVILSETDSVQSKCNKKRSRSPSEISVTSNLSDGMIVSNARAKVTSFFNGLRQRNVTKGESSEAKSKSTGSSNFLGYIKKKKDLKYTEKEKMLRILDENLEDEFKDMDPTSDDKLFGTELFDDLEDSERRVKYEEQIAKYQNTIDMMSKLKMDLEAELELIHTHKQIQDKKQVFQQENSVRTQITHLNEQIKCVMFLLMQCKMGLENLNGKDQQLPEPCSVVAASGSENNSSNSMENNIENLQLI